jgi:hypothetical protein
MTAIKAIVAGSLLGLALTAPAFAQDSEADKAKLAQCERDVCGIIVSKQKDGPDVTCDLTKTWAGEDIEKGAREKSVPWGFGKTQCSIKINAKRSILVQALTSPEYTIKAEKQTVSCEIERGTEKYPIKVSATPELKMKDGKVVGASLNIGEIEGATLIKGVVWTASTLEKNFGLFEKDLLREANKFIERQCPKRMAEAK